MKRPLLLNPALRAAFLLPLLPIGVFAAPEAVNDAYTTNEDTPLSPSGAAQTVFAGDFEAAGADVVSGTWQYLDKIGNHLATPAGTGAYPVDGENVSWKDLAFDVATSTVGPWGTGTMGAGSGIQGGGVDGISSAAVLTGMTGGASGQYVVTTYLFRKVFTLTAAQAAVANWDCSVLVDDGAIIYINGQQVAEVNMGAGETYNPDGSSSPVTANTATTVNASETSATVRSLNLAGKLNAGSNVIAVEVHQANVAASPTGFSSSDVGLNLTLVPGGGDTLDGFTAVEDAFFGTNRPNNESEDHQAAGGFNATGGLHVRIGNSGGGGGSRATSAGWRKTFSLAAPATVTLSFRHRLLQLADYDAGEYSEIICDLNGTQYGTVVSPSTHKSVDFIVGNGDGGGDIDNGWKLATFTIPLAAGNHTLTLGAYNNTSNGFFGGGNEATDAWFDDVSVSVPSAGGGLLDNDTGTAPVTAVKDTEPTHGTVTLNADGTFTYTPDANYSGPDSFTYHAHDSTGDSPPATVSITVTPVNDPPAAANDGPYTTAEETTLNVAAPEGLLVNDTDAENSPLTASLTTQSVNGTATVNADGSFSFVPAENFSGTTTFAYRISDGAANSTNAIATINVTGVPDDPVAAADSYTALKNTPLVVTATTAGTTTEDLIPQSAAGWHYLNTLVLANRNLGTAWRTPGYVENADWAVGPAQLGFGDGDEATVIEDNPTAGYVNPDTNKFPTCYFRREFTVANHHTVTAVELAVLYDDAAVFFINGVEVARSSNLPTSATMPELAWDYLQTGIFNDNIIQTFPLQVSSLQDGANLMAGEVHQNASDSSDLSFDVRLRVTRLVPASVLANDTDPDPGTTLAIDSFTQPAHGTVAMNSNGTFTYTPANGHVGSDSFTYVVIDDTGRTATGTANITIATGPNVAPVAVADTYPATEDTPLVVGIAAGILLNDTDAENDPFTAVLATQAQKGTVALNADGSFTYTPNPNASGTDSFTYTAFDGKNSPPATVTINIAPVNDAPVAVDDNYQANPGETITISAPGVVGNDSDIDTAAGSLTAVLDTAVTGGTLNLNASGGFSYTAPAAGGTFTFTYFANDGSANSAAPATVTIVVNGAPTAASESYPLVEDNVLTIGAPGILANDSDPELQPLTAVLVAPPASGNLNLNPDGSFVFTPALNFAGVLSFTYKVFDGVRESAPATVTITVSNVNDAPVAGANTYATTVDIPLVVAAPGIMANDADPDTGASLSLALVSDVTHGTLLLGSQGGFTYTPAAGYIGNDSFTYRLSDGQLNSNTAIVTLTVSPPTRNVRINEIMYHPTPSFPEPVADEWIELRNTEGFQADLSGWQLTAGVSFTFPPGTTIPSQGFLVVAANLPAFQAKYPTVTNVVGSWIGSLGNSGEKITLSDTAGASVDSVSYSTEGDWALRIRETAFNGWDWQTLADGGGRTLELRQANLDNDNGANWGDSTVAGGTPGAANSIAAANVAPLISKVKHSPAVPKSTDAVTISCELADENPPGLLTAVLFWRDATTTSPGAFQQLAMIGDGSGDFSATLPARANLNIVEFYVSASDGLNTRTWPAPTSEGQNANCQYQVDNEVMNGTDTYHRMVLTAAENNAFNNVNQNSDRQFNQTLIVSRGAQHDIRYRSSMRIRGNSSRSYQFKPLRINIPADDPLDGQTKFNLNPRAPHLQYLGQRVLQSVGLAASDAAPVELRRNGVESTTSSGGTPDFGKWVRLETEGSEFAKNHWPENNTVSLYKKIDGGSQTNHYWRSAGFTVPNNPDGNIDGWSKSNNSSENDWSDLTHFFSVWQAAAAPHFPGAPATDVSGSTGGRLSGTGAWNTANAAFTPAEYAAVAEVSDLDYWARWFAAMIIIQDVETNLSNGVDDDYSAAFITQADGKRRMLPIAHDLDTIFGLGDTTAAFNARGLYDMCENGETFRTLLPLFGTTNTPGNATFRALYHQYVRQFYGGILNADTNGNPTPAFHAFVDTHLTGWAPAGTITAIKTFATQRQAYLLGLIGDDPLTPAAATANATFTAPHGTLMIHEILANNVAAVNQGGLFPDLIELYNQAATPVIMDGKSLTDDAAEPAKYVFPSGTSIPAGGYLVLLADGGSGASHLPFSLNNSGETVTLFDSPANGGGVLDSISFGLQPPDRSIGRTGAALTTWALCTPTFGSPNTAVAGLGSPGGLKINEWLGNPDYMVSSDFVEIYNSAAQPVAIGGMVLTDDIRNYPTRFVFPQLSFVPPSSFSRFDGLGSSATPGNATEVSFKFDSSFGSVTLRGANGTMVDTVDLVSQPPDVSTGRSADGTTNVVSFPAPNSLPTPGLSNATPPAGIRALINTLRITEVHFNPGTGAAHEFIELQNTGAAALELQGVRFTEGIDFVFPAYSLQPGAYVVVVRDQAGFESVWGAGKPVAGVYSGSLDNGGESVGLMLPQPYDLYIHRFEYKDSWEVSADGAGDSLQIINAASYAGDWDEKESWQAGTPTPGGPTPFQVQAGLDVLVFGPEAAVMDGSVFLGAYLPAEVTVAWSKVSGPGTVTFTTTTAADTNARFSLPGTYELKLTGTGPGGATSSDTALVIVQETYASWASRTLGAQPPASQLPEADPDFDGLPNLVEFALGGNPLLSDAGSLIALVTQDDHLTIRYQRNLAADPSLLIIPQISDELSQWNEGPSFLEHTLIGSQPPLETWQVRDLNANSENPRHYIRLQIILP